MCKSAKVMKTKTSKIIKDRLKKKCVICGKEIKVIRYMDNKYRGGHFFGKVPVCSKKETMKALKAGTKSFAFNGEVFQVMKKDPKPSSYYDYWECLRCYK